MTESVELKLAELLAARLCHELVNPVGAVSNGVELLEDEPDFAEDATRLIAQSALIAARRLQYYRIAYGSTQPVAVDRARKATLDLFLDGKVEVDWPSDLPELVESALKLACCVTLVAAECLPRGGRVSLSAPPGTVIVALVRGPSLKLDESSQTILTSGHRTEELTSHNVHAAFTAKLAQRMNARIGIKMNGEEELIIAVIGV